jgi:hypothetical protein
MGERANNLIHLRANADGHSASKQVPTLSLLKGSPNACRKPALSLSKGAKRNVMHPLPPAD